jgi:hypothetical protein
MKNIKTDFVSGNGGHFTADIRRVNDQRYERVLVVSLPVSGGADRKNLQLQAFLYGFGPTRP